MQTLLVAVDGSESSLKGVRHAAALAASMGLTMRLVNVLPPILLPPATYADTIARVEEGNRQAAAEILARAKEVAAEAGVKAETAMVNGAPAEALADLAQAEGTWGVVIGAKGHNVVARVLLGSVADRLVHICPRPVLVVR